MYLQRPSHQTFSQPTRKFPSFVVVSLILVLVALAWISTSTISPPEALVQALAIAPNSPEEARQFLNIAANDPRLKHWVIFSRGDLLEKEGQIVPALRQYRQVSAKSAASLDAALGILRLSTEPIDGQQLVELEQRIIFSGRSDLLPELLLIRGIAAERSEDLQLAFSFYRETRHKYPQSSAAKRARTAQYRLGATYSKELQINSPAQLKSEVEMLIAENDAALALDRIELIKSSTAKNSEAYLGARLLEEQVLRKLRRGEEADEILLTVSADGDLNTADIALFRLAKQAWNVNNHHDALTFLDKLKQRFPESPLLEEARYTEARVLEELNLFPEAKDIYEQLATTSNDVRRKIVSLQRVAWMYFRIGNLQRARESLSKEKTVLSSFLESASGSTAGSITEQDDESSLPMVSLEESLDHASYWEMYAAEHPSLATKGPNNVSDTPLSIPTPTPTYQGFPRYYQVLSSKRRQSNWFADSLHSALFETPNELSAKQCFIPINQELINIASLLDSAGLNEFAQREIDWYFHTSFPQHSFFLGPDATPENWTAEQLQVFAAKLKISGEFGQRPQTLRLSDRLLLILFGKSPSQTAVKSDFNSCLPTLFQISFPLPMKEVFEAAAEKSRVSLPLLLAIARTESHFDPRAISKAGALGMLQIMPKTAEQEGALPGTDLFDPEKNLPLGAKHLAGLLSAYNGEEIYAIAAYNAGSTAVNRWLTRYQNLDPLLWIELIGYPETKNYVKQVLTAKEIYQQLYFQAAAASRER